MLAWPDGRLSVGGGRKEGSGGVWGRKGGVEGSWGIEASFLGVIEWGQGNE